MPIPQVKHPEPAEIVARYKVFEAAWEKQFREGRTDRQYYTNGPWKNDDARRRNSNDRLALVFDEYSQYGHKQINQIRSSKRGVNVQPAGNGATKDTASTARGLIMQIGYASKAPSAREFAMQNAVIGGFGAYKIIRDYKDDESDEQVLRVVRIADPDSVMLDMSAKNADFSDGCEAFEKETMTHEDFKREYGETAKRTTFLQEDCDAYPAWITSNTVRVVHYWKVHKIPRTTIKLDMEWAPDGMAPSKVWDKADLPKGYEFPADLKPRERTRYDRVVWRYITNGVEILEKLQWTLEVDGPTTGKPIIGGRYIPLIPVIGEEVYVDNGSGPERQFWGMFRRARGAYQAYCYYRTAQAEHAQQFLRTPVVGVAGQFQGFEKQWSNATKGPMDYVEYNAVTEATGPNILGAPSRPSISAEIQQLDLVAESARRAIQTAIGVSNPMQQRRGTAPLSGKALQEFQAQGDLSNFHFPDNFDAAIELEGRIMADLLPVVYDSVREEAIADDHDEETKRVMLNDPQGNMDPRTGQAKPALLDVGTHSITVSAGPDSDSLRQAAGDVADTIIGNPQVMGAALQQPGSPAAKMMALALQLRDLGPIGDQMAEIFAPDEEGQIPAQVQAAMQQKDQIIQQLAQELQRLQQEQQAKLQQTEMQNQSRERIAAAGNETQIAIAELKAQQQTDQMHIQALLQRLQAMEGMQATQFQADREDMRMMNQQSANLTNERE